MNQTERNQVIKQYSDKTLKKTTIYPQKLSKPVKQKAYDFISNKNSKSENPIINEYFVEGANLSLGDIEVILSRQIKWIKLISDNNDLDKG
tara:strand:- start:943 stop:1215 length:273 start_codon:yes stop_codon:yes gene_type:complete